jgi:RNA polymerase sigma-70 factor (ECF subfamily)
MQHVAAGEEEAIARLYDRFGTLVFKAARQVLPSAAEADDAVQEVFVRLWQSADRYDPRRARLVTWVMLIARRHLIDRLRRRAARPAVGPLDSGCPEPGVQADPERATIQGDVSATLAKRIAELPKLQREVIEKAYFQGYTLREISEQMNAPLGTIKSALSRGLARLRERTLADEQAM